VISILNNTCCFIGHRKISETEQLKEQLYQEIENLITQKNVNTFFFGSKSQFDDLCYKLVTQLKMKYKYIKRIYVRAEYPSINEEYKVYLLKYYEDTYYPEKAIGATKSIYVKRNYEMIEKSKFCIIYYKEDYSPNNRKSGTKIALDYALQQQKIIIQFPK